MCERLSPRVAPGCRSPAGVSFGGQTRRSKGGSYPLPHLYETFGLVRLTRLGRDVPWAHARAMLVEAALVASKAPGPFPKRAVILEWHG